MKKLSEMIKIADNIYRANATSKSYYIVVGGVPKFCIQERFDKLLNAAGGDYQKLVAGYKSRGGAAAPNVVNDLPADTSDIIIDTVPANKQAEDTVLVG